MKNFFEHQEAARFRTVKLVLIFSIALLGTVLLTALTVAYCLLLGWYYVSYSGERPLLPEVPPELFLFWFGCLAIGIGVTMISISVFKIEELRRGGGAVVAGELGGDKIEPEQTRHDLDKRKVLNIVEEMAIASRIPPPPVYLLAGQTSINAFAVGYHPEDAVLGVTQGCIARLNREQLQGVIAHEFSHIFNGDMRMNLQLLGILHGVLGISMLAEWLLEMGGEAVTRPSDEMFLSTAGGIFLLVAGGFLWLVGVIGLFFALVIKAATSRQREFLADASAVEFTRNPDGLGGALKVIAGHKMGSRVRCAKALEASHLFFAKGCGGLAGWLDSHPPLDERIRRIDPSWDGVPQFDHARDLHAYEGAFQETMNLVSTQQPVPEERITPIDSTDVCEGRQLGIIDPRAEWDAAHAEALRTTVPGLLLELAEDVDAAPIVLYGLWLSADREDVSDAASRLDVLDEEARIPTKAILSHLSGVEAGPRMILFDLAVKALDSISSTELRRFAENARRLAGATSGESFFHWVWDRMATSVVRARSGEPPAKPRFGSLDRLLGPCELLLSVLAHAGGRGPLTCYSFQRAASQLGYELALRPLDHCTLKNLDLALAVLEQVSLACRRRILLACAACISSDQAIAETEAYLIRGICVALGFPAPALLPGQPVAPGS